MTPSDLVYMLCVHALQLRDELFDDGEVQKRFFDTRVPRSTFEALLERKIENTPECLFLLDQKCENGHKFLDFINPVATRFFNCLSKNFIGKVNDAIHASKKRTHSDEHEKSPASRKIQKLQSSAE